MIACIQNQSNELENQSIHMKKSFEQKDQKNRFDDNQNEESKEFSSMKLAPLPSNQTDQKQSDKKTFPYFRQDDKKRLSELGKIIQQAQKDKPIRLYLENVPNFANEFDFEDKCPGLMNVVWNYKRANSCFILLENKEYALDILDLESQLPPFSKAGRIFVTRAEQNSILYGKKPNPKRFESFYNLSDNSGFFIVEQDKMKYFWYDQKGGFYDEYGIYYNQSGRPSPPPYINTNNRANRSRKGNRGNYEKNNNNSTNNGSGQQQKQMNSSPKLNSQRSSNNVQYEYVKKQDFELSNNSNASQSQNGDQSQNNKNNIQQQPNNNNRDQQTNDKNKKGNNKPNRPKSHSSGSNNTKPNNKQYNNNNNNGSNNNSHNNNNNSDNNRNFNHSNNNLNSSPNGNNPGKSNPVNNNNNNQSGGFKKRQKSNSASSSSSSQQNV